MRAAYRREVSLRLLSCVFCAVVYIAEKAKLFTTTCAKISQQLKIRKIKDYPRNVACRFLFCTCRNACYKFVEMRSNAKVRGILLRKWYTGSDCGLVVIYVGIKAHVASCRVSQYTNVYIYIYLKKKLSQTNIRVSPRYKRTVYELDRFYFQSYTRNFNKVQWTVHNSGNVLVHDCRKPDVFRWCNKCRICSSWDEEA